MARIRIDDLPVSEQLSAKQTQGIFGGQSSAAQSDGGATFILPHIEQENILPHIEQDNVTQNATDPYSFTRDGRSSGL